MITNENIQNITKITEELFKKLETSAEVKVQSNGDGTVSVFVQVEDSDTFIGENGETLLEIQHVLRAIIRKKIQEPLWILVDINEYQKNKETYLKEIALSAANDVALFGKEKELSPMNAKDRRAVHVALSERHDVLTESIGEEPNRRIVIKPKGSGGL